MANESALAGQKLSSPHDRLIAGILASNPNAKTTGFLHALRTLRKASYMRWMARYQPEWFQHVALIPDAYIIDEQAKRVTVFEAVCSNEISADKMNRLIDIAMALDEDRWDLHVVRVDRFGAKTYDPVDVFLAQTIHKTDEWQCFNADATATDPLVAECSAMMKQVAFTPLTPGAAA